MFRNSFIYVLLVLLLMLSISTAGTIHVPGDYSTIQAGLDAASAADTVLVAPGSYFENLIWPNTQSIRLLSEQGAVSTIIDGGNIGSVISITFGTDTSTVIDGFTIQHGLGSSNGGGMYLEGSATICNNIISSCWAANGGGIYCSGNNITVIESNSIQWNEVGYVESSDVGYHGAGICASGPTLIQGNSIIHNINHSNNPELDAGGGIYVSSDASVFGNQIMYNEAYYGAAFFMAGNSVTFQDNLVLYNESPDEGIVQMSYSHAGLLVARGNQISSNTGNGMNLRTDGVVTVDSCTISDNTGHGIRVGGFIAIHVPQIHFCNIFGNSGYGVSVDGNRVTDATYCWWGDPSGPGGVGPGTGDEVSEYVLYNPWLTELGIEEGVSSVNLELSLTPNPFTASSTISFDTPASGNAVLKVFDLSGRLVETLIAGDIQEGSHSVALNADGYSPGIYLIRLQAGPTVQTERCVLLR